ncbi:hypothetical protein DFP72DRAFT_907129 [Ephemerocybe angulata]|uniref:Uncharacterized protein n=1 Tax=Ephemerocybe angulata TaxID=980116 RepID=A0A8H6HQS0_9AGAR|nr:hypothetical protein DFP72DRAFT_907129 [Tulosesus angulatus]
MSERKYRRTGNIITSTEARGGSEIEACRNTKRRLGGPLLHSCPLDCHISPVALGGYESEEGQKGGGGEEGRDVPSGGEQEVDGRRTENRHVTGGEPNGCEEEPIWVPGKSVNRVRHTQAVSNMSRYKDPGAHSVTPSPRYAAMPHAMLVVCLPALAIVT